MYEYCNKYTLACIELRWLFWNDNAIYQIFYAPTLANASFSLFRFVLTALKYSTFYNTKDSKINLQIKFEEEVIKE